MANKRGGLSKREYAAKQKGGTINYKTGKVSVPQKSRSGSQDFSKYYTGKYANNWAEGEAAARAAGINTGEGSAFDIAMNQRYNPINAERLRTGGSSYPSDFIGPVRPNDLVGGQKAYTTGSGSKSSGSSSSGTSGTSGIQKSNLEYVREGLSGLNGIDLSGGKNSVDTSKDKGTTSGMQMPNPYGTGGMQKPQGPSYSQLSPLARGLSGINLRPTNTMDSLLSGVGELSQATFPGSDVQEVGPGLKMYEGPTIQDLVFGSSLKPIIAPPAPDNSAQDNQTGGETKGQDKIKTGRNSGTRSAGSSISSGVAMKSKAPGKTATADEQKKVLQMIEDLREGAFSGADIYDEQINQLDPQFAQMENEYKLAQEEQLNQAIQAAMGRQMANNALDSSQTAIIDAQLRQGYGNQMKTYLENLAEQKNAARNALLGQRNQTMNQAGQQSLQAYMQWLQFAAQQQQREFENQMALRNYGASAGQRASNTQQQIGRYANELADEWVRNSGGNPYAMPNGREQISQQIANVFGGGMNDYMYLFPNGWESRPIAPSAPNYQSIPAGGMLLDQNGNIIDPYGQ